MKGKADDARLLEWQESRQLCEEHLALAQRMFPVTEAFTEHIKEIADLKAQSAVPEDAASKQLTQAATSYIEATVLLFQIARILRRSLARLCQTAIPTFEIEVSPAWLFPAPELLNDEAAAVAWLESFSEKMGADLTEIKEAVLRAHPEWASKKDWQTFFDDGESSDEEDQKSLSRFLDLLEGEVKKGLKGRPAEWTAMSLGREIRAAVRGLRKRLYRPPTLKEVADELNKRKPLTEAALKMLIKRHGLNWQELKKGG